MRTAVGVVRLIVYVSVAGPLLAYMQLLERKRYRSQEFRPDGEAPVPQHQAEGVGPEETARFKKLYDDGLLGAFCDRVLERVTLPALARKLVERRRKP